MRCPVCKAAVEQGPSCRRCRADLSLLFAAAAQGQAALAQARALACTGRYEEALAAVTRAGAVQDTAETRRWSAALRLWGRDFTGAWREYGRAALDDTTAADR